MNTERPVTRRTFVAWAGGTGAAFYLFGRLPGTSVTQALAAIPGGSLDPLAIPQFETSLLVPPVMPRAGTIPQRGGQNVDYYEISMRQFRQRILPATVYADLPGEAAEGTLVWGYGALRSDSKRGLLIHNAPSLTIEANWKRPVRVKWVNELRAYPADPGSAFLPHLLPVDPTLHWANPPGGELYRDTRPTFETTPGPYTGPVPIVTHLHGAAGVGDESDGYAEAWFLPQAGELPVGHASTGTWYAFFAQKAAGKGYLAPEATEWEPGTAVFQYPNAQRASTLWYHDHALGMTRLNVYAGPAGFYLLRGGPDGDDAVRDSRTGAAAILPGPAPDANDTFPSRKRYREIPLAIQDRAFNADGSLFYPDTRAFFDEIAGPYLPETDVSPIWNPEFFGNTIIVNGNTWPFLEVERRRYRFRLLNGCQSRFLILDFDAIPGAEVWQIGNEGGFLTAPVDLGEGLSKRLLLGPAERADVIVDFTGVPLGNHILGNLGPDEPFGGGVPDDDFDLADPDTTGRVLQFRVVPSGSPDTTTPPRFLELPPITPLQGGSTRPLALVESMSTDFEDAPVEALLGTVDGEGLAMPKAWAEEISENPAVGSTEVWEFHNFTADAHPMHIHEVHFQVVNRQALATDEDGGAIQPVQPVGEPLPPEPAEHGWKDTVIAYPGQVTRVRMRFEVAGQYVWHCHIVEHEDNEMMRPYRIGPEQAGQPMRHEDHHRG